LQRLGKIRNMDKRGDQAIYIKVLAKKVVTVTRRGQTQSFWEKEKKMVGGRGGKG